MNRKKRKNGIRFLLFLILFGFVAVKFGNKVSGNMKVEDWSEKVSEVAEEECSNCNTSVIEEKVPIEQGYEVLRMDKGLVDLTKLVNGDEEEIANFQRLAEENGDVAGLWDDIMSLISMWNPISFLSCSHFNNDLSIESAVQLCNDDSSSTLHFVGAEGEDIDDGGSTVSVNINSRVVFSKVQYPLTYFLGQYVFENSKREISFRSTEYSASGEVIDIDYQAKTLTPEDAHNLKDKVEDLGTSREPFLVGANLTLDDSGSATKIKQEELDTRIGIENEDDADGPCPFARHDFNPETSNYIAYDEKYGGYLRSQVPGGNDYKLPEDNQCYRENKDYYMSPSKDPYACFNLVERVYSVFRKVFARDVWDECMEETCREETYWAGGREWTREVCTPDPEKCVDATTIGIEMTPLFGKPYECNEPLEDGSTDRLCANAFLTESYKGSLSPDRAGNRRVAGDPDSDGIMYFIGTDCELSVSSGKETRQIPVTCLWDATPNHLNYQLQAKDRAPGQEDFPQSFHEYWQGVLQAIEVSYSKYWSFKL